MVSGLAGAQFAWGPRVAEGVSAHVVMSSCRRAWGHCARDWYLCRQFPAPSAQQANALPEIRSKDWDVPAMIQRRRSDR